MNTTKTISVFIFEAVAVLDVAITIDVIFTEPASDIFFAPKETAKLREVLRLSAGSHVDTLSAEEINEFGATMLKATAIVLKAKYAKSRLRH